MTVATFDMVWGRGAIGPSISSANVYRTREARPSESLFREFGEAAASAQRELAQAVSEEVESQLADILVCLGEETTKVEVLSGALARMGMDAPAQPPRKPPRCY